MPGRNGPVGRRPLLALAVYRVYALRNNGYNQMQKQVVQQWVLLVYKLSPEPSARRVLFGTRAKAPQRVAPA
jgi:hypothetical protein